MIAIERLERQALRLDVTERAKLAQKLLLSLDELSEPEAETLWVEEAERRFESYKRGESSARPARSALERARKQLSR